LQLVKRTHDLNTALRVRITAFLHDPLLRNAYALMLNTVATSGLGLVYWWLAARIYDQYNYGWNAAIIPTMTLLSSLAQLNMNNVLTRFVPIARRRAGQLIVIAYGMAVLATALLASGFVTIDAASVTSRVARGTPAPFLFWFIASSMLWSVFALQDYVLIGLRASVWVFIENAIYGVLKIILLIVLFPLTAAYGIFLSWTLPLVLMIIPVNWLIGRRLLPARDTALLPADPEFRVGTITHYVTTDYLGAIFWLISTMMLPIVVLTIAGPEASGFFYTAWVIGFAIDLVAANMSTSLTVEGAHDQTQFAAVSQRALIQMARLIIPVVILSVIFAPQIMGVYGPSFAQNSTSLLRWLALGALPRMIVVLFISRSRVRNRTGQLALLQALTCALVIGLSVVLLPIVGIAGVGIAWFTAQTVAAVLSAVGLWWRKNGAYNADPYVKMPVS
jgi:O-antigen/teichoic acid export membrane protein